MSIFSLSGINNFITRLFDENAKTLKRYRVTVDQINELESSIKKLSDEKLKNKTAEFRKRVAKGESLDSILPEAFAVVREAADRTLGMRHYDVQFMAALTFHEGKVAEQKTGEGKTLSATPALYLNALTGKGAHLVTVNDYLAQLGAGWMGPVFEFLNVSIGVIVHDQSYLYDSSFSGPSRGDDRLEHFRPVTRKEAYSADITYGTNNEFGFDYLRDNMAQRAELESQREHHFAIVDEADSILIDEARTPLIISAPDAEPTSKYAQFAQIVQTLERDADYAVDEKMRSANLTDLGVKRVERKLSIKNLYEEAFDTIHHIEQALRAHALFNRDKDYIVQNGEVVIVDEHTGRLMYGRRYSDGLHQAIEAKEGVTIQQESRTLATVSLQNYFRQYEKLAGMTGTAVTESEEFRKIYSMDVVVIPTHRPISRTDHPDVIYKTTRAKFGALVKEVEETHPTGRPILIGTRSIQHNDIVAEFLKRKKIPHQVLNAKNHEKEAFIIADAGRPGAITVATNIAGRGVDIVLGGAQPERGDFKTKTEYNKAVKEWEKQHKIVTVAGGLHVIGTERHESRRIDNQLRGRSGRQGDPGSSKFFVSLEDEIMRIFGGEQISKVMDFLKIDENEAIENPMISKAIEQAQVKVEGFFFDQRKRLVEFDDVMNKQREIIYARRRNILHGEIDRVEYVKQTLDATASAIATLHLKEDMEHDDWTALVRDIVQIVPYDETAQRQVLEELKKLSSHEELEEYLRKLFVKVSKQRESRFGKETAEQIDQYVLLSTLDEQWMNHLDDMDNLREGIWLRGDKQTVLTSYKQESFEMFEAFLRRIDDETIRKIFRVQPVQTQRVERKVVEQKDEVFETSLTEQAQPAKKQNIPTSTTASLDEFAQLLAMQSNKKSSGKSSKPLPALAKEKIGRNDPCPCGSGKKYKKCHMLKS